MKKDNEETSAEKRAKALDKCKCRRDSKAKFY